MTPAELRAAQEKLGLSGLQMARVLRVNDRTYRRWLAGNPPISDKSARAVEALLAGWRPDDWPGNRKE